MEINRERFVTLCEDLGLRPDPSYNGRGMYSKRCVGVEVNAPSDLIKFLYLVVPYVDPNWEMYEEGETNYSPEWENTRYDSMGSGQIWYWPGVQAVDVEDAEKTLI